MKQEGKINNGENNGEKKKNQKVGNQTKRSKASSNKGGKLTTLQEDQVRNNKDKKGDPRTIKQKSPNGNN